MSSASLKRTDERKISTIEIFLLKRYNSISDQSRESSKPPAFFVPIPQKR